MVHESSSELKVCIGEQRDRFFRVRFENTHLLRVFMRVLSRASFMVQDLKTWLQSHWRTVRAVRHCPSGPLKSGIWRRLKLAMAVKTPTIMQV